MHILNSNSTFHFCDCDCQQQLLRDFFNLAELQFILTLLYNSLGLNFCNEEFTKHLDYGEKQLLLTAFTPILTLLLTCGLLSN